MKMLTHSVLSELSPQQAGVRSSLRRLAEVADDLEICISGLLDLARLEGSDLAPGKTLVNLQDIFQQIDLQFEEATNTPGIKLVLRATDITLFTDEAMLLRILENLVSNAIKFTRCGVLVAARPRGRGCVIEVWDQGPGIQPGTGHEGIGLGLAVVKRLANCLKYRVTLRSKPGKGCVMRVLIPAGSLRG